MDSSVEDIKLILSALEESKFAQAEVVIGDTKISVGPRDAQQASTAQQTTAPVNPASPVEAATPPVPTDAPTPDTTPAAAPSASGHEVKSPSVGVFWRAPSPGAEPFVEVGQRVNAGDAIGIVEVMKLMNNVVADVSGVVTAVHVENAGQVEAGSPLITIDDKG